MNFSPEDCSNWLKNKLVNPLTGRKIQEGKGIYKDLEKACKGYIGFDDEKVKKSQSPKKQSPKKQSPKKQSPKKQSPKKQYNPNSLYKKAKNFEDLLDINILYIQKKIRKTMYFSGPIDDEIPLNLDNLIKLHKVYKIYTTDSQPNFKDDYLIQKSYLTFIVKEELGKKLAPLLFASPYIYTAMYTPSITKDNFPNERYNVTKTWMTGWKEQTNWNRAGFLDLHDHFTNYIPSHGFKNVSEILKNCYVFYIANKDDTNVDTDVVLLDILNNI